mgnify:CR=1 FL=1
MSSLKFTPENIRHLEPNQIFVYGANEAGIHGAGAAKAALDHYDAEWGVGIGRTGQAYAIPTKSKNIEYVLPIEEIEKHVKDFIKYMEENPNLKFWLTRVGCGFAGYTDEQIAPLFKGMPINVSVPRQWLKLL